MKILDYSKMSSSTDIPKKVLHCCHFTELTASDSKSGYRCGKDNGDLWGRKCPKHDFWVCGHHIDLSPVCGKCAQKLE
jgi:hypothetical protein